MDISLSKKSEIPVHQQLAEQIVFLITTGRLHAGQQVPSVRSLARRLAIHHNTVSKAYQDLVRRDWLRRRKGRRLYVGAGDPFRATDHDLDELINDTIQRARAMGYSLQALRESVVIRLSAQPPDHLLVVEQEPGLRRIIQAEIYSMIGKPVEVCSQQELSKNPELSVGAQLVAPEYVLHLVRPLVPRNRPSIPLIFSAADEHVRLIRSLPEPSIVAVASVSQTLLKTARSLLASALGSRHTFREVLISPNGSTELRGVDIAFCDSLAMPVVRCRRKIHYRLIAPKCLEDLAAVFEASALRNTGVAARKSKSSSTKR
jgi:GntR family transcriptional regulator